MNQPPTRGWLLTRGVLAFGVISVVTTILIWVAMPQTGGGFSEPRDALVSEAMIGAGLFGIIIGFGRMLRIMRRSPEAGASPWRYRDH